MKSSKQLNDPWAKLDAMMAKDKEPTGPEWFTVYEYSARYKVKAPTAYNQLHRMIDGGLVEKWTGMAMDRNGTRKTTNKYRIK